TAGSLLAVNQNDVSTVYRQDAAVCLVPASVRSRRGLHLVIRELARLAAVAADDEGRRLFFAGFSPFEEEPLRVGRPSQARRRVAYEIRAAHDAVDGQLEAAAEGRVLIPRGRFLARSRGDKGRGYESCREREGLSAHEDRPWKALKSVNGGGPAGISIHFGNRSPRSSVIPTTGARAHFLLFPISRIPTLR